MPGTATIISIDGTPTDYSDPWIDSLVAGGAWKDSNGGTVSIQWTAFQGTMDGQSSYGWTSVALAGLREALSLWETVANIDFVEVSGATNADVKFWWGTETQADGALGWSDLPGFPDYYENEASETRDILFNAQDPAMSGALDDGGLGLVTMVHEIGHLLGLAHPHDGGAGDDATTFPGVTFDWSSYEFTSGDGGLNRGVYTVMSYNFGTYGSTSDAYGLTYGPMALDIAAIQAIYGANTNHASGNTIYRLPTTNGIGTYWKSIWDTGGVDTVSGEGATGSVTIDLRPAMEGISGGGRLSSARDYFGVAVQGGYTIARGVVIENAIGSDNSDTLIGNAAINRLEGGKGWDSLDGGAGADIMIGGEGYDTYYVDDAGDIVVELPNVGYETDIVYSTAANYTLSDNIEHLTLSGTASINGKGSNTSNTITGNSGDNVLESGGNGDTGDNLHGLAGNDRLVLTELARYMADGGIGTDTVALGGAGLTLDIADQDVMWRLRNLERVDLTGTGNNTLIVNQASVLNGIGMAVGSKYVLVVEGNAGDQVHFLESNWTKTGSFAYPDGMIDRWEFGNAQVHVKQGISVQTTHASAVTVLSSLNGGNGFKLSGGPTDRYSGISVASAGDVNGDGFDDVIVGSRGPTTGVYGSGASYVVFGKASGFAANIDLPTLNSTDGFKLNGVAQGDRSGRSVASAGDVNGDGFADLIIGGPYADPNGESSGASYVVFGKAAGFGANFNLSTLDGSNGFRLIGQATEDFSGWSVASAGDFNGDGFDDMLIGAWGASLTGVNGGAAYIVYGKASGFAATIDLSTLNANTGLKLAGAAYGDMAGSSVASAGDVNGDGYDDIIMGAQSADTNATGAGASYVVFGRASGISSSLDLSALNGSNGFKLSGVSANGESGRVVASAGDINGDGLADLIVGAPNDAGGRSYVVFGKSSGFTADVDLSTLNGANGFRLNGSGTAVASAGDFNGDGFADLVVGDWSDSTNGGWAGASYVMFGKASGFAASIDLATLNGDSGLRIAGAGSGDSSGRSVASAGDVNGDGYDDLIIGADRVWAARGATYVVFGGAFGGSTAPVTTTGTIAAEILIGGRGDDVLTGGGGGDVFHAGAGNDRMIVEDLAFDLADGGTGTDTLVLGGAGLSLDLANPLVAAKLQGIERIDLTGTGNNTLIVSQLALLGGIGSVVGGKHILVVERNVGDTVQFAESNWINAGTFIASNEKFERWVLGNAEVHFRIGAGATIVGTAGDDVISTTVTVPGQPLATALNDVIDGGLGADRMAAGAGDDVYIVDNVGDRTIEAAGEGVDLVRASISWTLADNVENLELSSGADHGFGNGLANRITGNAADNTLDGGLGADSLAGGLGNDTYWVDDVGDVVVEGVNGGIDTVLSSITHTLQANVENLTLTGAGAINGTGNGLDNWLTGNAGINTLAGAAGNDTYVVDLGDIVVEQAGQGTDTVRASASFVLGANVENLTLTGSAHINGTGNGLANLIEGNAGNNVLDGGAGADTMAGGLGDDTYRVDVAGDVVTEGVDGGMDTVEAWVSWRLDSTFNVEILRLMGTADLNGVGDHRSNFLYGNSGRNLLIGAGGDDVLDGGANNDAMLGGIGDDTFVVDSLGDVVVEEAGEGTDTVNASLSWALGANFEQLRLMGTANLDGAGNALNNVLFGNAGRNVLDGGAGADMMNGGLGDDIYTVDQTDDAVVEVAGGGTDLVQSSVSFVLGANVENLALKLSANIDATGNELANVLTGNLGNNVLDGREGADTMAGSLGDDTYVVDNAGDTVTEVADGGSDRVLASVNWTLGAHVETLLLTGTANIDGTGNELANVLTGNAGNNVLDGGAGADTMAGGLGDDTYVVDVAGDVVTEGAGQGTDTINAWLGWTLGATFEHLRLLGTADLDGTGNGLNNALFGNAGKNLLNGGVGADTMAGGLGDDTYMVDNAGDVVVEAAGGGTDLVQASVSFQLGANVESLLLTGTGSINGTGNELVNVLTGNGGKNVLDGGAGADTMVGGAGDDSYVVDNVGDSVTELGGGGRDAVLASVNWTLGANVETLTLTGIAHLAGTGNELANTLTGNAGKNLLDGGLGADTMAGGLGDDTYVVDVAGDVVTEGADQGTDTVNAWVGLTLGANLEQLRLLGTADLNGTGNALNNALFGNAGRNVLNGGVGADTMMGGLGDDTYIVDQSDDVVIEAANAGTDLVQSTAATYQLGANVENLVLLGKASINGTGNLGRNELIGNAGNNVLDGGVGADTMAGGAGNDSYVVDNVGDVVTELAGGGLDTVMSSLGWTLGANLEKLTLTGTAALAGTGNELANTLTGNAGANTLDGGAGADTMAGGLGNDIYVVDQSGDVVVEAEAEGIDLVRASVSHTLSAHVEKLTLEGTANLAGTGNDLANTLTGNGGNNILDGKAGADTMAGGLGDDTYIVDDAGDTLTESVAAGIDTVQSSVAWRLKANFEKLILTGTADIDGTGNELANVLTGNTGINLLDGGLGADTMAGGRGNDTYVVDDAGDLLVEGAGGGSDTVQASISYALQDNLETLLLTGKANLDGTGNAASNTIVGNRGNNVLDGGAGADRMEGGAGSDTYVVDIAGDLVVEAASGGDDEVQASFSYALTANVERLRLTGTANLGGTGNELANTLTGNAGDNLLDGRLGADTMVGGLGDDTYIVDNTGDVVTEAVDGGVDAVQASVTHRLRDNLETLVLTGSAAINGTGNALDNVIFGNSNNNVLDGAAGADTMEGGRGNDTYIVDDEADMIIEAAGWGSDLVQASISHTLAANVERLTLTGNGDTDGTGNGLTNTLTGNAGDNRLDGGLGADTMAGGLGDDTYLVDNVGDAVTELANGGIDTVLSSIGHTLRANVENLVLTGDAAVNGTGNALANALTGNGANNVLDGDAGADVMSGGEGDDTYMVDNAGDLVIELASGGTDVVHSRVSHVLTANVENLTLAGKTNIDAAGNGLANVLTGNVGRNVLDGGLGADMLAGGGGGDTFRFSTALGPDNVDRIVLFNHNTDAIQLDHTVFAALATGGLAAGAFNLGVAATQADDRILFDTASKSLYYDADGLGGADAVRFATIDAVQGVLDHTDFLIV